MKYASEISTPCDGSSSSYTDQDDLAFKVIGRADPEVSTYIGSEETKSFKTSGYYVSKIFDFGSGVSFDKIYWFDRTNPYTSIKVYTRSSDDKSKWTTWYLEVNDTTIDAPSKRYLQYKIELSTTNSNYTPFFDKIVIKYSYSAPAFTNMQSSGTDFTTSENPKFYENFDENDSPWNVSWQVTPNKKGNYTIRVYVNSSDTNIQPAESQWINISVLEKTYLTNFQIEPSIQYRGANVTISVRLLDSLSNPIPNQNITFKDETDSKDIGYSLTDNNGYAIITYQIPTTASLGYHTIKAEYNGNSSLFYYSTTSTSQLKVSSMPIFNQIILSDEELGIKEKEKIQVNVTDDVGLDKVLIFLTYPNQTTIEKEMIYSSSTKLYEYTTEELWEVGDYSFYIFANNTDGISNTSETKNFYVKIIGRLDVSTEKDKYKNFELVKLSNEDKEWPFPNYTYRQKIYVYSNETQYDVSLNLKIDTKKLISEGKLNPNCSDIKFVQVSSIEELPIKIDNPYGQTKYDITFPISITDKETISKMKGNDIRIFSYQTNNPYGEEPDIPFWIDYISANEAKIWIRLNQLPTSGKTIYLYYGNSTAESKSNYTATFNQIVGEAGIVYTNDTWINFNYLNSINEPKFVFSSINSYNGADEAFSRITQVNQTGFHVLIQESSGLDQVHAYENIAWLALRNGSWIVHGKLWQIGNVSLTGSYSSINFYQPFSSTPVVLSQIQTYYDTSPLKTRMNNPSVSSIDIKIEPGSTSDTFSGYEEVAWFAAEEGNYQANAYITLGRKYHNQGSDVSSTSGWTTYDIPTHPETPAIIAKIQTENGGDNSHERIRNVQTSSFEYAIEEEYGYDGTHTDEWNGYIAIQPNKPIYGTRYLDTWPSSTEQTNQKRIVQSITTEIPFWIEGRCNSENTSIWIKLSELGEGKNEILMYYGNPYDTNIENSWENETKVFTYNTNYGSYVVLGIQGANLDVASFSNNNEITLGSTTTTLNKQQTYTFSSSDVTLGKILYSKAPVTSGTESSGDGAPLTPLSFKGKQFVVAIARYDPIYFDFYALEDARIEVYVSNPAGSAWKLNDTFSLSKGQSTSKSYPGTDSDVTAELSYKIVSSGNIVVFFRGNTNDYMPIVPANIELYLEPSNYLEVAALENETSVTIYFSDGRTPTTLNLDAGDVYTSSSLGVDGTAPGVRIVSNKPVFAYQIADSDGTEVTPGLPRNLMDYSFVFPQDAEYFVAITPANEVTHCELYDKSGNLVQQWTVSATTNEPGKIGYGTGQDGTIYVNAGYLLACNNSVYVYFEQATNDAETLIYGPKAHIKEANASYEIAYEEDKWVNLENNGNETIRGYLWAIVQKFDENTQKWINIPPAIINDLATNTLREILPGNSLNLTYLWEAYGAWNTSNHEAGKYRVLFVLQDLNGNPIYDYELRELSDSYEFEILPASISLINFTHPNKFNYNLQEYETGDIIDWINLTIKAFNNTAINTNVHLTLIDQNSNYAGFGPNNEVYNCGNIEEGNYCKAVFTNSSNGYPIPTDLQIQNQTYNFKINATMENGNDYINTSNIIVIHNIPSTFNSTKPDRLYQNGNPVYYNFSLRNLWSKNLTNVKVKINCPNLPGLSCECLDNPGSNVCSIGNLTSNEEKTVSFKITATEDTPTGDYIVNATVNYTNPANREKVWHEQRPETLEIRTIGIMEITPYSYPTKVTRGQSFEFKSYANNTGSQTANEAWLAYSEYPSDWSLTSGQQNVTAYNVAPNEYFWNNVTFSTSLNSQLGPRNVKLESGSDVDQHDFKYVTIYVYGNTSLEIWVNDSLASRGEVIRIYAKLKWDNSTPISNQQISFYDQTDNLLIGSSYTDNQGIAFVDYLLNDSTSLGNHIINVSYKGSSSIYTNPSSNQTQISVGLKPKINSIEILPSQEIGYGENATIKVNATDDQSIVYVKAIIQNPNGESYQFNLAHISGDIYQGNYTNTWINGSYSVQIIVEDSYGSKSYNQTAFEIKVDAKIILKTEKDVYYPAENVKLDNAPSYPFLYKRRILIENPLNQNLTEYQVNLIVDTASLINQGKMNSDCSDMRFTWLNESSNEEEKISYFLDYGCDSNETSIWVKIPIVYSNRNTTIYMYYGNENAESESNESEVFSYSKNETTFYVVGYPESSSSLDVIAFEDNTFVNFNGNSVKLNKGENYQFSASNDMTSSISHNKPIFGAFSNDVTDALHPISWAGKKFVYYAYRGTDEWYFYAPFGDAQINISNSTHLKATINLANGSAYRAQVDIENGDTVIIESNVSILARHAAPSNSYDSRILYPASTKVYGIPSQNLEIAALEDGTHVNVYCSDGSSYSYDLNRGQNQRISGFGSEGTAPACVVIANKPIGVDQIADSDGVETTTFLPLKELDRVYYLAQPTQYIAIAAPYSTTCKLYSSSGTLLDAQSVSPSGNVPGKIYFGSSSDGTNIQAGSYIVCDNPVFAYYEYSSYDDETNLFGMKANRKFVGFELNYSIENETPSGSAVLNFGSKFKGYLVATIEKNESGSWQHVSTLLNDTLNSILREFSQIFDLSQVIPSWNPEGNTGHFRITVKITNENESLLNSTDGYLINSYEFDVIQVPLRLNISQIRIYEAPNNEHGDGIFVDSGINKTFNLEKGKIYRIEIDVDVLSNSQIWDIGNSNVSFSNLNENWTIDVQNNVWYLNESDSNERLGGVFENGILKWNTSENDGYGSNGTKVTFYFILNLTDSEVEECSTFLV